MVMSSLRRPKKLTLFGNDEKEYKFLVKGGEDLRLDERVEQVFPEIIRKFDEIAIHRNE